jgi:hypothetical protein
MLAALVGAPVLVVLTVNTSIRPMIVTSGGLSLQHLLIDTVRTAQLICAKPAVVIFLIYVVWVSFKTGFTLGPHRASAHKVWGLARTFAAEQDDRPLALARMQVSALILAATFGSMLTPYGPKLDMYSASLASSMKL